ncbi:MAG: type II toxin-antitoxin system HigB family toxin [Nitrospira sp.]|nr:type II toxin-antitoxin system HigB family toxin [Nitrospira sp.]MDH4370715.1 type II toxin-antitoxin system HigB family toxin [Nitrospira sp.]MDH5347512.1 type II toxin-antitoxin system HigB family toxin [Nitrospira sp.]MDH5498411.1 type II toxin-antitoxin system HigB family toxin [Nitrospira sp.]MDH5724345.1 type II toxin-antitoxin system HigB family toxin [Nitrospira sp.]
MACKSQDRVTLSHHNIREFSFVLQSAVQSPSSRVQLNVAGNQDRLVVKINYPYGVVYIRFIGTHAEYDAIDVTSI